MDNNAILLTALGGDKTLYYHGVHTAATSAATSIDTGITGLDGKDFLLVLKNLDSVESWKWIDTKRGMTKALASDGSATESTIEEITISGSTLSIPDSVLTNGNDYLVQVYVVAEGHFDIQTYTGTGAAHAESHDLGVAPFFHTVKSRTEAANWYAYHEELGATKVIYLDATSIAATFASWNNTVPTTTVFSVGAEGYGVNDNTETYVAYLWADSGLYKSIAYEGNGNATGPTESLTNPVSALIRNTESSYGWYLFDEARSPSNPADDTVQMNSNAAEVNGDGEAIDFNSGNIQIKSSAAAINENTKQMVGLAVLEQ